MLARTFRKNESVMLAGIIARGTSDWDKKYLDKTPSVIPLNGFR